MKKKAARWIGIVAIVVALMIAFSGVAAASWLTEYTPEKQNPANVDWKSSSGKNFLDNPTWAFGKVATKWNESGLLPAASSKRMNAYSKLLATDVQATTRAEVGMAGHPILNYNIDAGGLNSNEESMATGRISAGMSVYVVGDPILSYEERSSASGSFQFHKVMSYTSKILSP